MERRYYVVQAQVITENDGYTSSIGVPTFYLDVDVQGIVSDEHAESIARKIVDPLGLAKRVSVSVARI